MDKLKLNDYLTTGLLVIYAIIESQQELLNLGFSPIQSLLIIIVLGIISQLESNKRVKV